jgi:hypothetical protein
MVDGNRHNHLVTVCEMEGYTGDISRAMWFCEKYRDAGCGKKEGSEPLEGGH